MMPHLPERWAGAPRDLRLFVCAIVLMGFAQSAMDAVFNNFLNDTYALSSLQRTLLEVPREIPGFLVVFVSALLFFLCSRRLAAVAAYLQAAGLVLIALLPGRLSLTLAWLFLFSLGVHIFLPLSSGIGMELAREGATGRRLGQFNAVRAVAAVVGSFAVFAAFRFLRFTFAGAFLVAAAGFACAGALLGSMTRGAPKSPGVHLRVRREYGLFYWLSVLYGTRKQIFITFAPWVLVTVFGLPTHAVAMLLTAGGVLGIAFQPFLGRLIDRRGERFVLCGEALVLIPVCLGYGLARRLLPPAGALALAAACFLADQLLISVGMARATWLKKIAAPDHVAPTLAMGVSIDHVFSIAIAVGSGAVWAAWGYEYVFLAGAAIAAVNFFSALRIRVPAPAALTP